MTEAEQHLVDVALLMAQELQEYVDVAIECSGSNSAELATQELLKDWEAAYAAVGLTEEDHFKKYRGWHYPKSNHDTQNMPPADTYAVGYYIDESGNECGPVILRFSGDVADLVSQYQPITRWHAISEE